MQLGLELREALNDRGIGDARVWLEPTGLPGRYRLRVVSKDFRKLDYSDRLGMVTQALDESWDRHDRLRITLIYPLDLSEARLRERVGGGRTSGGRAAPGNRGGARTGRQQRGEPSQSARPPSVQAAATKAARKAARERAAAAMHRRAKRSRDA